MTGSSRGAGRGIALALGEAGATVYVTGRSVRGGPAPADGASGTIEDTAEEVTARGGRGVAVRVDHTVDSEVAALFDQVKREQGRLDVLANAVWGGNERYAQLSWSSPFWHQPLAEDWHPMMAAGPYAYLLASGYAARLMAERKSGLIVHVLDGIDHDGTGYRGHIYWDLAHECISRMVLGMSLDAAKVSITIAGVNPGFMRTERVKMHLKTETLKKQMGYERSESVEFVGRAVAALAGDPNVASKNGKLLDVADLAEEYGFTDVDGTRPRFHV